MPRAMFEDVLLYLRHAAAVGVECDLTDAQLLDRFLTRHEESAFGFLVRRHGPMILSVGRRVLGDLHEAEDVLQATFLILARRSQAIRGKRSVGGWLHGVAHHVALKAKAKAAARRKFERKARTMPAAGPIDALSHEELRSALDEAIASLSAKYHAPIVLCYLEGKSYDQAARALGCPKTTLARRLAQARELLRKQLTRRGISLSAAALATALTEAAAATPLPAMLAIKTVKAAGLVVAGKSIAGCLSAGAMELARETVAGMVLAKGKVVALVVALGLAVGGVGWAGFGGLAQRGEAVASQTESGVEKKDQTLVKNTIPKTDRYGDALPQYAISRLGTVRFNHGHRLNSLFFLPDGKKLLSEGSGYVRLWDTATATELRQFPTMDTWSDQTTLSADGKYFTMLSQTNPKDTVRTWDIASGNEVRALALPVRRTGNDTWHPNAISPDGGLSAVTMPTEVLVFDNADGKKLFSVSNQEGEKGLAVMFAGNDKLVTADKKQRVTIRDAHTGKELRVFISSDPADALAASADGSFLATLTHHIRFTDPHWDLHVWDLRTGKHLHALPAPPKSWYMDVRFSPNGKKLIASAYQEANETFVVVWDLNTAKIVREFGGGNALAVSPDGKRVAVGWAKFNLVDLKTGTPGAFAESRHTNTRQVFLAPAGDRAYSVSSSSVCEWDVASGMPLHVTKIANMDNGYHHYTHSPNGKYALTFEGDLKKVQIVVWDVVARKPFPAIKPARANLPFFTAFSADSTMLASNRMGEVKIWEIATGKEIRTFKSSKSAQWGAPFFTADGKTLIIAGRDVVGFDVATGRELFTWRRTPPPSMSKMVMTTNDGKIVKQEEPSAWRSIVISPDGRIAAGILTGGWLMRARRPNRIVLSNARTGEVLRQMDDSGVATPMYEPICFSVDSRLLATSDGDIIHLWEAATGREIRSLRGHRGNIESLSFSGNGRRLVSSSMDSTCLIWDLARAIGINGPLANTPGEEQITRWWSDLTSAEPRQAYTAIWRLAEFPKLSVPFLNERLHPVTDSQVKQIAQDIADLGSAQFATRKSANERLSALGQIAEPALRAALKANPPLETQRRVEQLLRNLHGAPVSGELLRITRALAVLERAGTAEAKRLIEKLAGGASGAWTTEEAKLALQRVSLRSAPPAPLGAPANSQGR